MAKGIQNISGDTKCGSPLAIFCIPKHFVVTPLTIFCFPLWQPPCHISYPHTLCGSPPYHILYPHTFCGSPLAIFCIPTHFVAAPLPYSVSLTAIFCIPYRTLFPHTFCGGYIIWRYTGYWFHTWAGGELSWSRLLHTDILASNYQHPPLQTKSGFLTQECVTHYPGKQNTLHILKTEVSFLHHFKCCFIFILKPGYPTTIRLNDSNYIKTACKHMHVNCLM